MSARWRASGALFMLSALVLSFVPVDSVLAQTKGTCIPVRERAGREFGCFITARTDLGRLPRPAQLYWHLDSSETPRAAEAAKGPRGTVVASLGRVWLFTIARKDWRPAGGHRVATIGPLPLIAATRYTAVYMEGDFRPGMRSVVHRHPGAEAWYTLQGSMCLETPEGTLRQGAGDAGVMMRGGIPMMLTGTGTRARRSLVLLLLDASKPWLVPATDWKPKGLCTV